jgi:hypothetical protein
MIFAELDDGCNQSDPSLVKPTAFGLGWRGDNRSWTEMVVTEDLQTGLPGSRVEARRLDDVGRRAVAARRW